MQGRNCLVVRQQNFDTMVAKYKDQSMASFLQRNKMARKKIKPLKKKRQLTEKQKEAQRLRLAEMRAKKKPPQ